MNLALWLLLALVLLLGLYAAATLARRPQPPAPVRLAPDTVTCPDALTWCDLCNSYVEGDADGLPLCHPGRGAA